MGAAYDETVIDGVDFLEDVFEQKGVACPDIDYATMFEELYDNFDRRNETSVEETEAMASKYVVKFLHEPDVDPRELSEILSIFDKIKYAREFKELRGYQINVDKLLGKLNQADVLRHWDELAQGGIPESKLLNLTHLGELSPLETNEALENGMPAQAAFNSFKRFAKKYPVHPDYLLMVLKSLRNFGLKKEKIAEFVTGIEITRQLAENFSDYFKSWLNLGISQEWLFGKVFGFFEEELIPCRCVKCFTDAQKTEVLEHASLAYFESIANDLDEMKEIIWNFKLDIIESRLNELLFSHGLSKRNIAWAVALYGCKSKSFTGDELIEYLASVDEVMMNGKNLRIKLVDTVRHYKKRHR